MTRGRIALEQAGWEDLYLGAKIGLTPHAGPLPEMALIPQMTLPTGSESETAGEVLSGAIWVYSWKLKESVQLRGSTHLNRRIDDLTGNGYAEWAQSAVLSWSVTAPLSVFAESYAVWPAGSGTARSEYYLDGGLIYELTRDAQLDFRATRGLNSAADDYYLSAGFAIRWK